MNSTPRPLKVFLCHASADKPAVRKLYRYLKQRGVQPWLDEIDLLPGQNWRAEIPNALYSSDVIVVCLSKGSVDREGYVQKEISFALDKALEKPEGTIFIIPAKLEDCNVPSRLSHYQWVDLFHEGGHKRLMQSLNLRAAHLGPSIAQASVTDESQSKEPDSSSPKIDISAIKEDELERNLGPMPVPRPRLIGGVVVALLLITLIFWARSSIMNNLPASSPSVTQISQPVNTHTPTLSRTSDTSTSVFQPSKTNTSAPIQTSITPIPELTIVSTMISDKDGMTLVYVPAGEFTMGSNNGTAEERPAHIVSVDAFWIDETEVTVKMYYVCVSADVCKDKSSYVQSDYFSNSKFNEYPMILVSWKDAETYCSWTGRRLPTEAEWEKAARGENDFVYPWGNDFDGTRVNFCDKNCSFEGANKSFDDGFSETAPVGSYLNGASPYGALDMAGNVWELVADWYDETYYASPPAPNPLGPDSGQYRVMRGGSWVTNLDFALRTSYRSRLDPDIGNKDIGFRCAMSETP